MKKKIDLNLSCPIPIQTHETVQMAHGGGGKLMHQLIENFIQPAFKNPLLELRHDGAVFNIGNARLAFSTDSYVVKPLFFPGGDIGTLAVHGTLNDLAMCGARPLYLSCAAIIEEGFPFESLKKIIDSMKKAAEEAGVQIVTGDTKVVDKGKGDGIFINTAGIGVIEHSLKISGSQIQVGDAILLNGDIARHGITIMAQRENLSFESHIESDTANLSGLVQKLIEAGIQIHCMRDLTRGGLASAAVELSLDSKMHFQIEESAIYVQPEVEGACEILGLDPLSIANEGRFIAFVKKEDAPRALKIMQEHPQGKDSTLIGTVLDNSEALVTLKSTLGAIRIIDMQTGEQLPRIC